MISLLVRWLANTLALFIVVTVVPHFHQSSITTLFLAALVLGLLNAVVRPILFWLTLPLTVITLGLFLVILNALMLELTTVLVPGFTIDSFGWAIVGAIVLGIVSLLTNRIGARPKKAEK
jgi:putative membrane protein